MDRPSPSDVVTPHMRACILTAGRLHYEVKYTGAYTWVHPGTLGKPATHMPPKCQALEPSILNDTQQPCLDRNVMSICLSRPHENTWLHTTLLQAE
jgi:hypothetical protein